MEHPFHTPVLVEEVCRALAPPLGAPGRAPGGTLVDATCGGGGHTLALLQVTRPEAVILMDRDPSALAVAADRLRQSDCSLEFVHAPFSSLADVLAQRRIPRVEAILADLGVSSHQLDTGARGFSWRSEAPLDMRMDPSAGMAAQDILLAIDAPTLATILKEYGEEPDAWRIAEAVVGARPRTTTALADVVANAMTARQRRRLGTRIHPATRTFQALRIHVNREIDELDALLDTAPGLLVVGGRLAVISFHSLEDRRLKRRFRDLGRTSQPPAGVPIIDAAIESPEFAVPAGFRGGVGPTEDEVRRNPRSRSARLRVVERCRS